MTVKRHMVLETINVVVNNNNNKPEDEKTIYEYWFGEFIDTIKDASISSTAINRFQMLRENSWAKGTQFHRI